VGDELASQELRQRFGLEPDERVEAHVVVPQSATSRPLQLVMTDRSFSWERHKTVAVANPVSRARLRADEVTFVAVRRRGRLVTALIGFGLIAAGLAIFGAGWSSGTVSLAAVAFVVFGVYYLVGAGNKRILLVEGQRARLRWKEPMIPSRRTHQAVTEAFARTIDWARARGIPVEG